MDTTSAGRKVEPDMKRITRVMTLVGLVVMAVATLSALSGSPAAAQAEDADDTLVVLTGRAEVRADEDVRAVIIFNGPATIDGTVREAVVAFNGDVVVRGTVGEDVVSLNGRVTVEDGAEIGGDVISRRTAAIDPGATVGGDVRGFDRDAFDIGFLVVTQFAWWLAVTISTLALGLVLVGLVPRPAEAVATVARRSIGPVIGWGLLALVVGPIVAVLVMLTLLGIPLGVWLLATVAVTSVLGYVTAAWALGRLMVSGPGRRFPAFLAGFAVLRAVALIPILGGLVWLAAAVVGTGALVVAAWRAATRNDPWPAPRPGDAAVGPETGAPQQP